MKKGQKLIKDISGLTFGNLTVLNFSHYYKKPTCVNGRSYWNCKCICGNEVTVSRKKLLDSKNSSCGCISRSNAGCYNIRTYCEEKKHKINCIMNLSHWEKDCLIWDGYTQNKTPKTSFLNKVHATKRLVWVFEHGEIPQKKQIVNSCKNYKCINIKHLKMENPNEWRKGTKHKKHNRL